MREVMFMLCLLLIFNMQVRAESGSMRFKTYSHIDNQGIGIEAFRMIITSDWKFQGGINWLLDNPAMPATAAFKVSNPNGTEELEIFPNQMFFWTNNQMLLSMFPIGARYFGAEVRPLANPSEFLQNILIPRVRGNVSELKIVESKQLPELAQQLNAGMQSQPGVSASADSAKIKIEYKSDGKLMEEEIYTVVEYLTFPIQSMYGVIYNTNWIGDYIFSFKASKGNLDASSKIFQTMVNSFKLNPQWFNKYSQLVEYLIQNQIQQIRTIGEISRIISQTSNEISDMMMKSYQDRQEVYDRLSTDFSQMIRGVEEYYDPVGQKPVELPTGYNSGWVNGLGEYILSEGYDFNPNIGSNQNWQRMDKR